jgi:hypothetical protein
MILVRYVQTLLFGVKGTAPSMLIAPALVLLAAALLAALPAVLRAARIDPSHNAPRRLGLLSPLHGKGVNRMDK